VTITVTSSSRELEEEGSKIESKGDVIGLSVMGQIALVVPPPPTEEGCP